MWSAPTYHINHQCFPGKLHHAWPSQEGPNKTPAKKNLLKGGLYRTYVLIVHLPMASANTPQTNANSPPLRPYLIMLKLSISLRKTKLSFWKLWKLAGFGFPVVLQNCPFVYLPWPKTKKNIGKFGRIQNIGKFGD